MSKRERRREDFSQATGFASTLGAGLGAGLGGGPGDGMDAGRARAASALSTETPADVPAVSTDALAVVGSVGSSAARGEIGARDETGAGVAGRAITVRIERAGRRGKTVTFVEGLEAGEMALAETSRALRVALGCGATVEADAVLLQGDQRGRVVEWLKARGATSVRQR